MNKKVITDNQSKIVVREAGSDDVAFFEKVYVASRRAEFVMLVCEENQIRMFLKAQFDFQTQSYQRQFPDLRKFVIEADDKPVGRLLLSDEIRLVDIVVLPSSRNRGIGSFVLNYLLNTAKGEGKDVFLQVMKTNYAARRLYERFGFETLGEDDLYLMMSHRFLNKIKSSEGGIRNYGVAYLQ